MNGSGLPRAVQSNLRQEQLLALGFRQVLARHVLIIVGLMGHIVIWGCLLSIREKFRRKTCKRRCRCGLSRCLSYHLFSCLCSWAGHTYSSKPTAHLVFMHQRGTERTKLGVVVPRTTSGKLERRLYGTVSHSYFNAWGSNCFLLYNTQNLSPATDSSVSPGHGFARSFVVQTNISKSCCLKIEHIVALLSF